MNMPKTELFGTFAIQGIDLRDYFAAKATEQDIQPFLWESVGPRSAVQTCTREEAKYKYADAMMKAREAK
jgi:hypothetical protein